MNSVSSHKQSLIFLTSLSHSGSTVFSMALACHKNVVSLGEVYQVLREAPDYWLNNNERICSCGQPAYECDFWGSALKRLVAQNLTPEQPNYFENAYSTLLDTFQHLYGKQYQAVDTSKGIKHLKLLNNNDAIDTKAIHLIRDVRAYACSQIKLARSQNRKGFKKVKGHHWYQMLRWLHGNTKRETLLNSLNLPYTSIGYESFCFNKNPTLSKTFEFLGLDHQPDIHTLAQSKHHVLFGNPMKNCPKRKSAINYDARWLNETDYMTSAALMPFVMQYNKSRVYAQGY